MFFSNQRIRSRLIGISRESDELKQLNMRLQSEVEQRKQAQESLAYAEQTLEQSSKLAALGQMSAAVAHELNQPLAAMKTYMAGANMLMERHRTEEAKTAFSRLDGLIDRMTTITKQLKSYAGKGADALEPVDVKQALSSAFSLVAQDYRSHSISYKEVFDSGDVLVLADRVRLEQVFINLLRNARDAVQGVASPQVTVVIESYSTVHIKFQDNGHGIDDFENLFEPFYTTKRPGDGIGLGLAISSGIIADFNGRLIAQNLSHGGAEFDVQLPYSPKS
jgi:two-component system C4-dicarboxylate transport sensor histidine kinase DctB